MGKEFKDGKVPLISKIAYGFGDVGCNFSWMFVSNFLMIFYTDVFGIGMAAVSALMLFSRFWDAINDPIVGGLTDKTHTRWGRYRPWSPGRMRRTPRSVPTTPPALRSPP